MTPANKTNKSKAARAKCFGYVAIALAACATYALILSNLPRQRAPVKGAALQTVQQMVQQEVPLGSSKSHVEAWLKKKKMEHSYTDGRRQDLNAIASVAGIGIPVSSLAGFFEAAVSGSSSSREVFLVFFIDKKGKLVKYTISEPDEPF